MNQKVLFIITKIISGGQTGADRAALDFAIKHNVPHGGWLPRGRLTENGKLPDCYLLQEMPTSEYSKRTEQNVLDSDGTIIVSHGRLTGGSSLTEHLAEQHKKCQSAFKIDPPSASKIDPPREVVFSYLLTFILLHKDGSVYRGGAWVGQFPTPIHIHLS